ncbi:fungal-specific transcription factor domain-containing protein [Xylariales sp. PMI_506]|nr:fungal-specific transcription factor domain-containing protein [Xylariales sp. PMI_506]
MQTPAPNERPYRSHLRPACNPCRRRKSRCKIEEHAFSCLMCRVHGTECTFPNDAPQSTSPTPSRVHKSPVPKKPSSRSPALRSPVALNERSSISAAVENPPPASVPWAPDLCNGDEIIQRTPLSVDDTEQENPHIVGPANTSDSQVLTDYLSSISNGTRGVRMIRPVPSSRTKPVLFASVKKRPVGMDVISNPPREKLIIIEKLLESFIEPLMDIYFNKVNICLPLLDLASFKSQYRDAKDKISPALLACLYAHTLVYWRFSPTLCDQRPPDIRFIWNLATEALYLELHLSPGISTITAILLNTGGRPTTSLVGNGVQLGAAVSLAHSLGLNRDPLAWDIPDAEKFLRMKIWWYLLIHDKWLSLAHGTPSHIQRAQYDVPRPNIGYFTHQSQDSKAHQAAHVFVALFGLTEVLDYYLQHLYRVDLEQVSHTANLEFKLNKWVETLGDNVRRIITRGTHLDLPGAANLRLAYLSCQLLLRRLELEEIREQQAVTPEMVANQYIQVRRTAEEIVSLVQELQEEQLGDFWLPMSAFAFPSTTTFLLRCALETENSQTGLAQSSSLRLAWDLITALRAHRDQSGWDLGDICLAQHAEIVEKLMAPIQPGDPDIPLQELEKITMPVGPIIDELFPSLWDTFRNY